MSLLSLFSKVGHQRHREDERNTHDFTSHFCRPEFIMSQFCEWSLRLSAAEFWNVFRKVVCCKQRALSKRVHFPQWLEKLFTWSVVCCPWLIYSLCSTLQPRYWFPVRVTAAASGAPSGEIRKGEHFEPAPSGAVPIIELEGVRKVSYLSACFRVDM